MGAATGGAPLSPLSQASNEGERAVGDWGLDFLLCPSLSLSLSLSQNHGQKEDILCVAQCPPLLLATSSYDGEIIIWNVISGHMHCKLNTPSPSDGAEDRERRGRAASTAALPRPAGSDSWHVV